MGQSTQEGGVFQENTVFFAVLLWDTVLSNGFYKQEGGGKWNTCIENIATS